MSVHDRYYCSSSGSLFGKTINDNILVNIVLATGHNLLPVLVVEITYQSSKIHGHQNKLPPDFQKKNLFFGQNILLPMQTSVFELFTCVVWGCPECYAMQEIYTGIYSG